MASLVAMMLGLGYTISVTVAFPVSAPIRDAAGSFDAVLWVFAVVPACAQFLVLLALPRFAVRRRAGSSSVAGAER